MKIHILEAIDEKHIGASIGEILNIDGRKMKVTHIENLDPATNRLTLED